MLQEPQEITLYDEDGAVDGVYHYIPLLSVLKSLLSRDEIREQVNTSHVRSDNILSDYSDGSVFRSHPLFSIDPKALQIIAYYDELELCNPLGTHIKQHKLGIVFFIIGNIDRKYRSTFKAINLAICAKYTLIEKHGINEPFVHDKILYNSGIDVFVNGDHHHYKGALLLTTWQVIWGWVGLSYLFRLLSDFVELV